jgi:hypothetical protein
MNPALSRLVLDHRCQATNIGDGSNADYFAHASSASNLGVFNDGPDRAVYTAAFGRDSCIPDHAAFKRLINQWGFALAPTAMHSARTVGFGGFKFSVEAVYTNIDSSADYWKLGTQGPRDPSTNAASAFNSSPPGVIQTYSAKIQKSFGFGLEVSTQVGFMPSTTILTGGADIRMALLEGFRTGFLGILPDVAVGGGVRTITGTPEFQLTTVGLDAQISKPLAIASQSVLTPWIGYQFLWIFGDSGLIDTTPGTDPVGYCQYVGPNVAGTPGAGSPTQKPASGKPAGPIYDGQPVCAGGSPIDFNNNVVFRNARLERHRMMFGLSYRYEMITVGGEFITDIVDPADAQISPDKWEVPVKNSNGQTTTVSDKDALKGVPRQWSLVLDIGTVF